MRERERAEKREWASEAEREVGSNWILLSCQPQTINSKRSGTAISQYTLKTISILSLYCPTEILWKIRDALPGESQLRQSRVTHSSVHAVLVLP